MKERSQASDHTDGDMAMYSEEELLFNLSDLNLNEAARVSYLEPTRAILKILQARRKLQGRVGRAKSASNTDASGSVKKRSTSRSPSPYGRKA
jgi:hypothetical protein